jgi:D-glycero-alpha-D-manno-heptose-7-phosphate kinase
LRIFDLATKPGGAAVQTNGSRSPEFVITKTPLRISFAGGGTDLPEFYKQDYGCVVSTTITQYIYVTVKRHGHLFNEQYRLNYFETENVREVDSIKNAIARECLRLVPVQPPIYISTVADLPSFSGLGSSSAFAVGLLNALHVMRGERAAAAQLAEEAAHVEIDVLHRPIGKQDHYACAVGGLNYIRFQCDQRVMIESQHVPRLQELFDHFMMFWTGIQRDASTVLSEQKDKTSLNRGTLLSMRDRAEEVRNLLWGGFDIQKFGRLLDEGWRFKRQLASGITNAALDDLYERAMEAGAFGGKLCGAGGGGFFLFVVPPAGQANVREAMRGLQEIELECEPHGTSALLIA